MAEDAKTGGRGLESGEAILASEAPESDDRREENPAASVAPEEEPASAGRLLRGVPVAPGLVLGPVHRKDYDLSRASTQRIPLDQVERELNRFHKALVEARSQLADLKSHLSGQVPADDARILDVHVAYLKDSVFISDVENLILNEQMGLEASIAKVISDFDRIFRLVENETLRERAVDLRDVGIRVLRHLEKEESKEATVGSAPPSDYVLVARELSIVDMFNLSNQHVLGILTEEGGIASHAAILARSMRIPTITGIDNLLGEIAEDDFVIVDASEGMVRVNPDEIVIAQYRQASAPHADEEAAEAQPLWSPEELVTHDGTRIHLSAACGNLPEVEQARALPLEAIGLYRTELMYLIDKDQPTRESLLSHYAAVLDQAGSRPVTFRLLDADSGLGVNYLHDEREQNPSLGQRGVRLLLSHEDVLRRQLQAILGAGVDSAGAPRSTVRIALPFVNDCGEVRRIKEILFEERIELRKTGEPFRESVELGAVLETPTSILGVRDLAAETDFLVVSLDSLLQYLLAADRGNTDLSSYFETLHPFVLRALRKVCAVCAEMERPLSVFGASAVRPENLPLLVGAGFRHFCVAPVHLREFAVGLPGIDVGSARRTAEVAARSACPAESASFVRNYRYHGFVH